MSPNFETLEKLIRESQRAEILYSSSQGILSRRKIEPLALSFSLEEDWLLLAFCHQRQANRQFQLKGIKEVQALEEYFAPSSAVLYRHYRS